MNFMPGQRGPNGFLLHRVIFTGCGMRYYKSLINRWYAVLQINAVLPSAEEAIEDFRVAIKTRLADKLGGLYSGTSDFEFQERHFRTMEEGWNDDGVRILNKRRISV